MPHSGGKDPDRDTLSSSSRPSCKELSCGKDALFAQAAGRVPAWKGRSARVRAVRRGKAAAPAQLSGSVPADVNIVLEHTQQAQKQLALSQC